MTRAADDDGPPSAGRRERLLGATAALFIRALRRTVRLRCDGDALVRRWERERRRFVLAFWHRHLLLMRYAYRGDRMNVLISRSRDGEIIASAMEHLGLETVRGSSSRGGVAGLRAILRRAREGSDLGFTPDGPRGPAKQVQPGVLLAAAAAGLPIVPVASGASRAKVLGSWDRMLLPLPGSRVVLAFGEPLAIAREARPEAVAPSLAAALDAVEARAASLAGERPR
jgi:lysophospholipid acyltransferase (LPLAT)-like uncharacterized protein